LSLEALEDDAFSRGWLFIREKLSREFTEGDCGGRNGVSRALKNLFS
jgi:hypothetical protein